jgi:hypothetical protein
VQSQRQLQLSLEAHGRYIASLIEQEGLAGLEKAPGATATLLFKHGLCG